MLYFDFNCSLAIYHTTQYIVHVTSRLIFSRYTTHTGVLPITHFQRDDQEETKTLFGENVVSKGI